MRGKKISIGLTAVLTTLTLTLLLGGTRAVAQQERVLHRFEKDGYNPAASLIFDAAGNLYGTTYRGGLYGVFGTVFELMPTAGGGWTEKVLHVFGSSEDGQNPLASLIFDGAGNLYGTTQAGGAYSNGTVFELSPTAGGGWREKVLHSFNYKGGKDGYYPTAGLILDAAGNLYGTTSMGGIGLCTDFNTGAVTGCGMVFELSPAGHGVWTERVLYSFEFTLQGTGAIPSGLIFDAAGNLYGTTEYSDFPSVGTVFELLRGAGGLWTEKVLHSFTENGEDGLTPAAGLVFDAVGNLYGTTVGGGTGTCTCGTVFELAPKPGGGWAEKVLHSFNDNGKDGFEPRRPDPRCRRQSLRHNILGRRL